MENNIDIYLLENQICYDRFTFDNIMRFLLSNDYTHEEAKDLILFNCCLSLIIFQERIDNNYYKQIKISDTISEDLLMLTNEILNSKLSKLN